MHQNSALDQRAFDESTDTPTLSPPPFQLMAAEATPPPADPSGSSQSNDTGLPNDLKSGIEQLSGYRMDDVNVHYNSSQPTHLQAHAYAQGTDIHLAPGQEQHLAHEAWHVVQQKQGRVRPTTQLKSAIPVNDDEGLEREADEMGAKALQMKASHSPNPLKNASIHAAPAQRKVFIDEKPAYVNQHDKIEYNGNKVLDHDPDEKASWFTDGWGRYYENVTELRDHLAGNPVQCGLAKPMGRWYRLNNLGNKLIVLGEDHGLFKHTHLRKESNRTGAFLSEFGTQGFETVRQEEAETVQRRRIPLESIAAKTMFGAVMMKNRVDAARSPKKKPKKKASGPRPVSEDPDTWIEHYQQAESTDVDDRFRPIYQNEGEKPKFPKPKSVYNAQKTANGVFGQFIEAAMAFDTEGDFKDALDKMVPLCKVIIKALGKKKRNLEQLSAQIAEFVERLREITQFELSARI
ncbi:MAG: DUF4157 domain-containing protein, partial [Bacteroidota bacterium]